MKLPFLGLLARKRPGELPGRLDVWVRREDLQRGIRMDAFRCPVSLALRRKTGARVVSVGYSFVLIRAGKDARYISYRVEPFSRKYLENLDLGLPVKPSRLRFSRLGR